ncbi:MAG: hypothetical protein LCH79_03400 [Proteobacteria bacterium]|jgi:hypothetical protein|nr:hypothetical protein [Pseudomonadota bacterium]
MTDPTNTKASPGQPAATQTWRDHMQAWMQRLHAALLRAEAHIMENFRVPPGGG